MNINSVVAFFKEEGITFACLGLKNEIVGSWQVQIKIVE